jgi:hypothetical protein
MAKSKKSIKQSYSAKKSGSGFKFKESDFSRENLIEGGFIRPAILMIAFFSFILAMFLLLIGDFKWGGSLIIFSFVLNLFSIYESLGDEPSIFKNMNLGFKFVLFIFEIAAFNWVLMLGL